MKRYRDIGVSRKSARFMPSRIREVRAADKTERFSGPVEVDETCMGGKRKNMPKAKRRRMEGRDKVDKTIVVGAKDHETMASRLLAEFAAQWLENCEWPRTDVQIQVTRSSLFTAQAVARDTITGGRKKEIEEIRNLISTIVPDIDGKPPTPDQDDT